uniref:BHLH domain-containing protein n=1 Tax=Glossina pallidipes TaxID=7398 RepID=A0A1A9ZPE1_GLOPL
MDYKNEFQSDDDFDCSNSYNDNYQNQSNSNGQNQYNNGSNHGTNTAGMSKAELRKTNKPIMEKRRRARINHCLNELKSLILEAMKKDPARHTKLEKADILEMTVKHLQSVQRQQLNMAIQTDPTVIHKFKTGFMECADEVNRYINQLEGVDAAVKQRLNNHLNGCVTNLEQIGSMSQFTNGYRSAAAPNGFGFAGTLGSLPTTLPLTSSLFPALPQDLNNNQAAAIQMGGVQLIPSRLPSGEFALIMPNSGSGGSSMTSALLNNNSNSGLGTWPTAPNNSNNGNSNLGQISPQINDFATNFKRLSAFTKPHASQSNTTAPNIKIPTISHSQYQQTTMTGSYHQQQQQQQQHQQQQQAFNSTTTASPPLSPISSISSSHNEDSILHNSSDFNNSQDNASATNLNKQTSFTGAFATPPSSAESSFVLCTTAPAIHLQQQQVSSTSGSELSSSTSSTSSTSSGTNNNSLKRSYSETIDPSICSEDESTACKKYAKESGAQDHDDQSVWRPW